MSAGVDDTVSSEIMGQIRIVGATAKSEVKDLHPRIAEVIAECLDIRRDDPEIFGNHRQRPQTGGRRSKELPAGDMLPAAMDRGRLRRRDRPASGKTAKMIDANEIIECHIAAQAIDPPAETVGPEPLPVVKGVPPALSGGGEVVGGDTGHRSGPSLFIELKVVTVRPDIGGIIRDKDRQIAKEAHSAGGGVSLNLLPLLGKDKLAIGFDGNRLMQFRADSQ